MVCGILLLTTSWRTVSYYWSGCRVNLNVVGWKDAKGSSRLVGSFNYKVNIHRSVKYCVDYERCNVCTTCLIAPHMEKVITRKVCGVGVAL